MEKESILDKINAWFGKHEIPAKAEEITETEEVTEKFETVLLADGETEATIEPSVEVGAAIVLTASDGTPVAAPVGEYELQDGRVVVVAEEGVVAEIRDAAAPTEEPLAEDNPSNPDNVKRIIERIEKEKIFEKVLELESKVKESEKDCEFLKEENEALTAKFSEAKDEFVSILKDVKELIGEQPSKEPVVQRKDPAKHFRTESGNYFLTPKKKNDE